MPINEGRLPTKVDYIGLKDRQYDIRDTDRTSRDFFGIVEMPNVFTAGKNLFKIKPHPSNLVPKSTIYIEILDSSGNTIYYKPIRYIEKDGTRVVAVYIYPDTAPGPCTVYLASRASYNPSTGQPIPFSRDLEDSDYYEYPNVLWTTSVGVAPSGRNDTEIIITKTPKITLSEVVQPYFQPITIDGVFTRVTSSFSAPLDSFGAVVLGQPGSSPALPSSNTNPVVPQGAGSSRSPSKVFGQQFYDISQTDNSLSNSGNQSTEAPPLYTLSGNNIVQVNSGNSFRFTAGMEGGVFSIVNPRVDIGGSFTVDGITVDGVEYYLPKGKNAPSGVSVEQLNATGIRPVFGTYKFAIVEVISGTKARIAQFDGFDDDQYNSYGQLTFEFRAFSSGAGIVTVTRHDIKTTYNFTSSFIAPDETVQTENFQSFADIILSDIEPETGDVFKIKTLYKPSGMFGDFVDLGDSILEEQRILLDTGSFETNIIVGSTYEDYGTFEDLAEIDKYWRLGYIGKDSDLTVTSQQRVSASYDDTVIVGGARIRREIDEDGYGTDWDNQASYEIGHSSVFSIARQYRPKLFKDTEYKIRGRLGIHTGSVAGIDMSEDPRIPDPRIDIYISGSNITKTGLSDILVGDNTTIHPQFNATLTEPVSGVRRTMASADGAEVDTNFNTNIYADGNFLGTRIGTVLLQSIPDNETVFQFRFKPDSDIDAANINFVIRSGEWTIGSIDLVSHVETGFSPNYLRIAKRIPTTHLNTPLTFKFQLFDYRGNLADVSPVAYGAVFTGENQYLNGDNNLITGSVTIGNAVGAGIELAGENSAYMRSIGYFGYSQSLQEGRGGFMLYSGSVLPGYNNYFTNQGHAGVGLELVDDTDEAHFIFQTAQNGFDSILDVKAKSFFIGDLDTQFISGANQNIEISSSIFHLDPDANEGAGGLVIGANAVINATLEADNIFVPAGSTDGADEPRPTNANLAFVSSSGLAKFAGNASNQNYKVVFDPLGTSTIAGWDINEDKLSNAAVHLSASYGLKVFDNDATDFVEMKYKASDDWGILGKSGGSTLFQLGNANQIAGWKFDSSKIISNNGVNSQANPGIVINSNGTIETDPFISGLTANATGWQIRSDGRAEFENAVIRGTLSTAVFEKDTVSVVGGQVMVANAAKLDKPAERFKDYPQVKSVVGEDINFSGETLPTTQSVSTTVAMLNNVQDASIIVAPTTTVLRANQSFDSDLFFEVESNGGQPTFILAIPSQSAFAGQDVRLSFYSNKNTSNNVGLTLFSGTTGATAVNIKKYTGPGVAAGSAFVDVSTGTNLHVFEYTLPAAEDNVNGVLKFKFTGGTNTTYYLRDIHLSAMSQSLTVDNAGGFATGEILVAKSTDQGPDGREGFVREYMRVIDTDLGTSETPASGTFDFSSHTIDSNTTLIVTASKFYTFTGTTTNQADVIASNQYFFDVGNTKAESLGNIKSKINAEVQDMFVNTTGSAPGVIDQLYVQAVGQGVDGNSYGMETGSTLLRLGGAIDRIKPTLTVERNMDARVSGNERGYFISKMKDGQSMASQGGDGTGYILLNAQPTDTNTPYIDIVERDGTGVGTEQHTGDDADSVFGVVNTVARLGDLSGITDNNFSDGVTGYGLYTTNGYFKGKIEVASLPETPSSEHLIARYPLDSQQKNEDGEYYFADIANNANSSGSLTASPGIVSGSDTGPYGFAYNFDNEHGRKIDISSVTSSFTSGMDLSVTFWAKRNSNDFGYILNAQDSDNASPDNIFRISFDVTGNLNLYVRLNSDIILSNVKYPSDGDNQWHHYAVIYEHGASAPAVYRDGIKLSVQSGTADTINNTHIGNLIQTTLGGSNRGDGGNGHWTANGAISTPDALDAQLANVQIWKTALTRTNVEALYLGPNATPGRTTIEGDRITTGKIRSNNWGASQGSRFDLDGGTFKLGGKDNPKLEWDGTTLAIDGTVSASAGEIGGWQITNTRLKSLSNNANGTANVFLQPEASGVTPNSRQLIGVGDQNPFTANGRVFNVKDTGEVTSSALLVQDINGKKMIDTTDLSLDSGNSFRGTRASYNFWTGKEVTNRDALERPSPYDPGFYDPAQDTPVASAYASTIFSSGQQPLGSNYGNTDRLLQWFTPSSDDFIVIVYSAHAGNIGTQGINAQRPYTYRFKITASDPDVSAEGSDSGIQFELNGTGASIQAQGLYFPRLSVGNAAREFINYGANKFPAHSQALLILDTKNNTEYADLDGGKDFRDCLCSLAVHVHPDRDHDNVSTYSGTTFTGYSGDQAGHQLFFGMVEVITCKETQLQNIVDTFSNSIVTYYTGSAIPIIRNAAGVSFYGTGPDGSELLPP